MEVNDNDFEEKVIKKSKDIFVMVDFWAEWCMPCRMLGPILEKAIDDYREKVVLAKVNVDDNPEMSEKYRVDGIPAVKLFRNGKIIDEFVGAMPLPRVKEFIEKNIK